MGPPVLSPAASQRKKNALEPLDGYIAWGCWKLNRKFRFKKDQQREGIRMYSFGHPGCQNGNPG
jgi:hypothetical protein